MSLIAPWSPNSGEGFVEGVEYRTEIHKALNGVEQRIQYRQVPQRTLEYTVVARKPNEAARLRALLHRGQDGLWAAAGWHVASRLTANLSGGASTPHANLRSVPVGAGDQVQLLLGNADAEVLTVQSIDSSLDFLTTSAGAGFAHGAGSWLIPCWDAYLAEQLPLHGWTLAALALRLTFLLQSNTALSAPAPAPAAPSQYLGQDLFLVKHNGAQQKSEQLTRRIAMLDTKFGTKYLTALAADPEPMQAVMWSARTRAEIARMWAFLDARRGSALSCWVPTWTRDLELYADMATNATSCDVKYVDYASLEWPGTGARRHLMFWDNSGVLSIQKVTGVTSGGGIYERLALSPGLTGAGPNKFTNVSFVRSMRQEQDAQRITYRAYGVADLPLSFRECPWEAPL